MKTFKLCSLALIFLAAGSVWAEGDKPSLFALGYYEFYGTPVQPQAFAKSTQDGLGFEVLAEFNPSYYLSVGLNFENVTFYNSSNLNLSSLGLETRVFAAPNGQAAFAPYFYAGAGLGLSSGAGNPLKIGLGSRTQLASPFFLDFAVGSNWYDNGFQYVNFRGGLSLSFDLPKVQNSVTPSPTKTSSSVTPTPTYETLSFEKSVTPTVTPTETSTPKGMVETVTVTPIATSEPDEETSPKPAGSLMKKYYKIGMKAYGDKDYPTAIENLKKALMEEEPKVQYYYYAEANATLGMIYHFHSKVKDHTALALKYYKRALKIDPDTKSAKKFIKELEPKPKSKKAKVKAKQKTKPKAKPTPTADAVGETDL